MTIVLPAAKRVRVRDISGDPRGYLVLEIPKALQDVVAKYAETVHKARRLLPCNPWDA